MKLQRLSITEVDKQTLYLSRDKTFESLCKQFHGKTYGISGHFIWHRKQKDGTVTEIKLQGTDTPSRVKMNVDTEEIISWKKEGVLTLFRK